MLRRVGSRRHADPGAAGRAAELGADHRDEPAQPPKRIQLPVVRQPAYGPAGAGFDHRVHRGGVQGDACARRFRGEGGPYDWVPPNYWYDTTHLGTDSTVTNAGGPGATTARRAP